MVLLRPGKTPAGPEIRGHLRRLVRQIRRHWPSTHITLRGDGHYGRPEVMAFCEAENIDYVFGLPTNAVLRAAVEETADDVRVRPPRRARRCCAAMPKPGTAPSPGPASAGWSPVSRPVPRAWISASWSPASPKAAPSGSTTAC